jgi:hypothetical protein
LRTRHTFARDRLAAVLGRRPAVRAADLAKELGVSVPTLHRILHDSTEPILVAGQARRTRYALRRSVRGDAPEYPLYAVDVSGRATQLSSLSPLAPHGSWMPLAGTDWPLIEETREGWWDGLPYPLYDMRPQGFLGRQLARAVHHDLGVPEHPDLWNDDDILFALSRIGADTSGNLILGDSAYERWQRDTLTCVDPLRERETATAYGDLAEQALAMGVAGSSAAGEFPKFPARRDLAGRPTPHVLVKFSGADDSPAVRRWADLLVCEHLALECVGMLPDVVGAHSRILVHAGRTFLEVERYDRHGPKGRSPLCSLETINAALLGMDGNDWSRLADGLVASNLLEPADAASIHHLWWFGRLIANRDMHLGNLGFRPVEGRLQVAPAYDMLPMRHAPLSGGELPSADWTPPLPLPRQRDVWMTASRAARTFWDRMAADPRISPPFRVLGRASGKTLEAVAEQL